jgi:hypothetical protein
LEDIADSFQQLCRAITNGDGCPLANSTPPSKPDSMKVKFRTFHVAIYSRSSWRSSSDGFRVDRLYISMCA